MCPRRHTNMGGEKEREIRPDHLAGLGGGLGWLAAWLVGDKGGTGLVSEGPPLQQLSPLHVLALHLEQHVQRLGLHPRTGSRPVT